MHMHAYPYKNIFYSLEKKGKIKYMGYHKWSLFERMLQQKQQQQQRRRRHHCDWMAWTDEKADEDVSEWRSSSSGRKK